MSTILTLTTISEAILRLTYYGIYYSGYGIYCIGRRLIKGKELTPEEKQDLILKQQSQILNSHDTLARTDEQHLLLQSLEIQLQQQSEIINELRKHNKETVNNE